ncbi:FAD/NAD(P)-binding protein [Nocardia sp. KC 131]|uniref:FAD/NAD(P)-binding protein n=1 Tax=Nocardia arseniciresistens TaxID=3392119 RepID=UPI00398EDB08
MHIGVIGAGTAVVGLLDALAALEEKPNRITVFEGSPTLWRGRPYQPDLAAVRVNVPPIRMSMRVGDPMHYQSWQADRDVTAYLDEGLGQPLVPRSVYGEYLEYTAAAAIGRLRDSGCSVRIVRANVIGFSRERHDVLHTDNGDHVPVDRAVLCVGSGRPRDHYGLTGAPGYVNEPYPLADSLSEIPADHHVAVSAAGCAPSMSPSACPRTGTPARSVCCRAAACCPTYNNAPSGWS